MIRNFNASQNYYFSKFKEGNEKGLEFFYKKFYPTLFYRGARYTKDETDADCIVSEAFLRLWLTRKTIQSVEQIEVFVKKLISDALKTYYKTSSRKFQRNMIRLDEIDDYQQFMFGYDPELEQTDIVYIDMEEEQKCQWKLIEAVIPNLTIDQQMFILLSLKYGFNYDRIAWHIGGISDYQVARNVENTLKHLKSIITNAQKLNVVAKSNKYKFEGDLSSEQSSILHMRYELQYSFQEISSALNLDQGFIQKVFVNACIKIKKVKR